jgi:signal transduction histidine kinase
MGRVAIRQPREPGALEKPAHDRLAQRAAALEAAVRDLQSFTYTVSHDLRAPLRAMAGFTGLLREDFGARLPAEGQRLLARVEANVARMGELIDGLLELSQAGLREMVSAPVDMGALAQEALRDALELAPRRPAVSLAALPPVNGDPRLLRQVWANLIGNALKYTRHAPEPRIDIGSRAADGAHQYYVSDNGAGFDMQHAQRLFVLFQRLHGDSEFEGIGVGLALVKRIVERHGGEVFAQGAEGQGATFSFTLPG